MRCCFTASPSMRLSEPGMNSCISLNPVSGSSLSSAVLHCSLSFQLSFCLIKPSAFFVPFLQPLYSPIHPCFIFNHSITNISSGFFLTSFIAVCFLLASLRPTQRVHNCFIEDCIKSNTAFTHTHPHTKIHYRHRPLLKQHFLPIFLSTVRCISEWNRTGKKRGKGLILPICN